MNTALLVFREALRSSHAKAAPAICTHDLAWDYGLALAVLQVPLRMQVAQTESQGSLPGDG